MTKKETRNRTSKLLILTTLTVLTASLASATTLTIDYTAYEGERSGEELVETTDSEVEDYELLIYTFEGEDFDTPEDFIKHRDTGDSTLEISLEDADEEYYGMYFYREDYFGWEESWEPGDYAHFDECESGEDCNLELDLYFTQEQEAGSEVEVIQVDELAAGDPVSFGVDITAHAPVDKGDIFDLYPTGDGVFSDNTEEDYNLTEYYSTEVGFDLTATALEDTNNHEEGDTVVSKSTPGDEDPVSIEFGDSKQIFFDEVIGDTGYYDIEAETREPDDGEPMIIDFLTNTDSVEVTYYSDVGTQAIPSSAERAIGDDDDVVVSVSVNESSVDIDEGEDLADIVNRMEYQWYEIGEFDLDRVDNVCRVEDPEDSDEVISILDEDYENIQEEDVTETSNEAEATRDTDNQGHWVLCHRAVLDDDREESVLNGTTSGNEYIIDKEAPEVEHEIAPEEAVYHPDRTEVEFEASFEDNIAMEEADFTIAGPETIDEEFTDLEDPSETVNFEPTLQGDAGDSYSYWWTGFDQVDNENETETKTLEIVEAETETSLTITSNPFKLGENVEITAETEVTDSEGTAGIRLDLEDFNKGVIENSDSNKITNTVELDEDLLDEFNEEQELEEFDISATGGINVNYALSTAEQTDIDVERWDKDANLEIEIIEGNDDLDLDELTLDESVRITASVDENEVIDEEAGINLGSNYNGWDSEEEFTDETGTEIETELDLDVAGDFVFTATGGTHEYYLEDTTEEGITVNAEKTVEPFDWTNTTEEVTIDSGDQVKQLYEFEYNEDDLEGLENLTFNVFDEEGSFNLTHEEQNGDLHSVNLENTTDLDAGIYEPTLQVLGDFGNSITQDVEVLVQDDLDLEWEQEDIQVFETEKLEEEIDVSYELDRDNLEWSINDQENFTVTEDGFLENSTALEQDTYSVEISIDDRLGNELTRDLSIQVTPNLYWINAPETVEVEEGDNLDLELEAGYIGSQTDLEWEITQGEDKFTVDEGGIVQKTEELDPGEYTAAVNVSSDEEVPIQTEFTVDVTEEDDSGSSSSGGSAAGASATTGANTTPVSDVSLSDKVSFKQQDDDTELDLDLSDEEITSYEFELEFSEETGLETSMTGNLTEIITLPENITGEGNVTVPISLVENRTGSFEGEIRFSEEDGEDYISRNISITVPEAETEDEELEVLPLNVYMQNQQSVDDFSYGIRSRADGELEEELIKEVEVLEDGNMIYEDEETFKGSSLPKRSHIGGENLETGEYRLEIKIEGENSEYSSSTEIELIESEELSESTTGSFFDSPTRIAESFNNHLRQVLDFVLP